MPDDVRRVDDDPKPTNSLEDRSEINRVESQGAATPDNAEPVTPFQQPVAPIANPASHTVIGGSGGGKGKVVLSLLLVIALVGAGALGYLWFQQKEQVEALTNEKTALQSQLSGVNAVSMADAAQDEKDASIASYSNFSKQYSNILKAELDANFDRATAKKEVSEALKAYYKVSTLPEGWAVLSFYQVVKQDTPPSGELKALVYWPESPSNGKSANFIPMTKPVNGKWQYEDLR